MSWYATMGKWMLPWGLWACIGVLATGCGDELEAEPVSVGTEVQAMRAGCTLLRPVGWSVGQNSCAEYCLRPGGPPRRTPMDDGDERELFATCNSSGRARAFCNDGRISVQPISCIEGNVEPD